MDIFREIQKLRDEINMKQHILEGRMRAEFTRFNNETRNILNSIDTKINSKVQEEVSTGINEIKALISNLKLKTGV